MIGDTYKSLIVDDELLAIKDLKAILKSFQQVEVVAEATNIAEAREALRLKAPDLIFLDIQLGKETGFDLIPFIPESTKIIFVTAYDEYAIRAFEVNARDYLLKPVMPGRLEKALTRLESVAHTKETGKKKLQPDDRVFLKLNDNYEFFKISRISFIRASDDYTEIHTIQGEKKLVLKSLKEWEERLPQNMFCRIHRSTIININRIDRIESWFNYTHRLYMKDYEEPLLMSRRYFALIKDKLG